MTSEILPEDDDALQEILAAMDDALANGVTPLQASQPGVGLTPRLRQNIDCVHLLQKLRNKTWKNPSSTLLNRLDANVTNDSPKLGMNCPFGRFVLKRELGRGGFGIVYLATDPHLGRDVALKVPRPGSLSDEQIRERFNKEAHAAAILDHPNIVPVYEAGLVGSVCYIASAYVPGPTLAEWVIDQKQGVPLQVAASMVQKLAEGVQAAHTHGVLHRDLKPANVLLADGGLVPRIADFGLAKFLHVEGMGQTQSGTAVGTPSYMSPEQTSGKLADVGPASDIYSLGAILYELLTGRPPIVGDSVADTLRKVRDEEPIPAKRLRPGLSRDLETICHHCLEKEARNRYASATDLASDLGRFLAGESILARPVNAGEKVVRWCRRRPLPAGLIAALVVVSVVGLSGIVWKWREAEKLRSVAEGERDKTRAEIVRSEADFQDARVVLRHFMELGEDLSKQPENARLSREVLTSLIPAYDGFLQRHSDDPDAWEEVVQARFRVARIQWLLGNIDRAEELFVQGIASIRLQPEQKQLSTEIRRVLATELTELACLRMNHQKSDNAKLVFPEAIALWRELLKEEPNRPENQIALGNVLINYCCILRDEGKYHESEQEIQEAIALEKEAMKYVANKDHAEFELALAYEGMGLSIADPSRRAESQNYLMQAISICREKQRKHQDSSDVLHFLSRLLRVLGNSQLRSGAVKSADASFRESLQLAEYLCEHSPQVNFYRREMMFIVIDYCRFLESQKRFPEAEKVLRHTLDVLKFPLTIPSRYPIERNNELQMAQLKCHSQLLTELGHVLNRDPQTEWEAFNLYQESLKLQPAQADVLNNLAWMMLRSTNPKIQDASLSVVKAREAVRLEPRIAIYWGTLSEAAMKNGYWSEAATAASTHVKLRSSQGKNPATSSQPAQ